MNPRNHRTPWTLAILLVAAALAGCLGNDGFGSTPQSDSDGQQTDDERDRFSHDLFGWVVDPSFSPLPAVNLSVIGAQTETTTNATGFYSLPKLPRGEELVVIAEHKGHVTQSKRVLLPTEGSMRLNFTLEPRPVKTPWSEVLEFEGLLACQLVIEYDEGHMAAMTAQSAGLMGSMPTEPAQGSGQKQKVDCGATDPNNADLWEFSLRPELAGVVVEASWDAQSPLAEHFRLTLEVTGHGGDDATLASVVGPSVVKAHVNNHQALRYYQDGGFVRASVEVDANVNDEETGTGLAFAYQQEFTIHATAFYVDPPPATYSFHAS